MIKRVAIILLSSVVLASCGFHLRGKYEYADEMDPLVIVTKDRDFVYELKEVFDFSGLNIVDSVSGADAILEFTTETYTRKPSALDERGRATRYVLSYKARYRVLNRQGDALLKRGLASATRVLEFDESQILQADKEEAFLKEEMYEDMAQAIARRLSRIDGSVVASAEELEKFEAELKRETSGKTEDVQGVIVQ